MLNENNNQEQELKRECYFIQFYKNAMNGKHVSGCFSIFSETHFTYKVRIKTT